MGGVTVSRLVGSDTVGAVGVGESAEVDVVAGMVPEGTTSDV